MKTAYVVILTAENGFEIGLAHEGIKGYTPGYGIPYVIEEKNGKTISRRAETYEEASDWVDELNKEKYGLDHKEAARVVMTTMF